MLQLYVGGKDLTDCSKTRKKIKRLPIKEPDVRGVLSLHVEKLVLIEWHDA